MRRALLLLAFATCVFPAGRATAQEPQSEIRQVVTWPQDKTSRIGEAMYRQDLAATRATEALMRHFRDQPPIEPAGWIVVGEGGNPLVRFLRRDGNVFRPAFEVTFAGDHVTGVAVSTDTDLPAQQRAMAEARNTAARNIGPVQCGRYNTVILRDPDSDGWLVWLLATANDSELMPRDGHYRFLISADGLTVLQRDQLFVRCRDIDRDPPAIAMMFDSPVSTGPLETHVYFSLLEGIPLLVEAGGRHFRVDGTRIQRVRARRNSRRAP